MAPDLAQFLARALPKCTFRHFTRPSHEIFQMLFEQRLDAGVATHPMSDVSGLVEYPLVRDPFVVVVPAGQGLDPETLMRAEAPLPLLRYASNQIIGGLIEAQLRRLRVRLPNRFELESNQSIMGMVAAGSGWAITTAASYGRARRFHERVELHAFPGRGFNRTQSLFTTELFPANIATLIAETLRRLIGVHFIDPVTQRHPVLTEGFRLLEPGTQAG